MGRLDSQSMNQVDQALSISFGLGSGENCPPLHSPQYDFPDEVIETGATLFYTIAEANQ